MNYPRREAATLVMLLLFAASAHSQELASWLPSTDRSANLLVAEILTSGPLEDRLGAASSLGLREDPYVVDLIDSLLGRFNGSDRHEAQLVLRVLLSSVFPDALPSQALRRRLEVNRRALEPLAAALGEFDAALAREAYRLLSQAADGPFSAALAAEGRRLGEELQTRQGYSSAEQADRLVAYLEAVELSGDPTLAGLVVTLLETTRTLEVGRAARRVLKSLLPGASEP